MGVGYVVGFVGTSNFFVSRLRGKAFLWQNPTSAQESPVHGHGHGNSKSATGLSRRERVLGSGSRPPPAEAHQRVWRDQGAVDHHRLNLIAG